MTYRLIVTGPAKEDIARDYAWWAEHRSEEQAARWLLGLDQAIRDLATSADRHAWASEVALRDAGVKQASFGLSRRPTHRVLYAIRDGAVVVYRVRAFKQDDIGMDELAGDQP